ncbi:MAG: TatD family hydrolase [Acidimicrobiia bacterium]
MFDTHCHFDTIDDARTQLVEAYNSGLRGINIIGCDYETTKRSIDIVKIVEQEREELGLIDLDAKATMGLHPHESKFLNDQKNQLESLLNSNIDLISGVGETGFDFYYNHSSKQDQVDSFKWQIDLAKALNKALVIHTRDAWNETFDLLNDVGWPEKVVMHCFTGGVAEAKECVKNGAYISISGIATFKNAQDIKDAIVAVPLNRLLCETDAPWLAPVPHRGKNNQPSYVQYVIETIIGLRKEHCGDTIDDVTKALYGNALKLFR